MGGPRLTGYPPAVIHAFGAVFFLSRLLHAWGVSHNAGYSKGRFWGMILTWLPMIIMALFAIAGSIMMQIPKAY